ncbi:hypothetical protein [Mesorhizobium sp. L48C026A00]|uniref:hypothetical protein n=1 Tax=Mesorhizobium sp. L48C026A00 TaxID=1287182 RepID=UPI0012EB3F06|nr:hypothetical protein [Mesorhizobium sp. L48C026A00]
MTERKPTPHGTKEQSAMRDHPGYAPDHEPPARDHAVIGMITSTVVRQHQRRMIGIIIIRQRRRRRQDSRVRHVDHNHRRRRSSF